MLETENVIIQEDAVILISPNAIWTPIKSKRNENGEITVEVLLPGKVLAEKDLCGEIERKIMDASVLDYWKTYALTIIMSIILAIFTHTQVYIIPILVFSWDLGKVFGDYNFASCLASIKEYALKSEYRPYWQMNTAVNKTINAYNRLGRIPTIEEATKFSKFREDSKLTKIFGRFIYFTIAFVLFSMTPIYVSDSFLKSSFVCLGIVAFNGAVAFIVKKKLGKYVEKFFLRQTTESDLKVAIAAVTKIEEINQDPKAFNAQYKDMCKKIFNINYFEV